MLRTALLVFCAALLPIAATTPASEADDVDGVAIAIAEPADGVALAIARAAAARPGETALKVTVRYTGPGQVSDARRIWVWLFDREPDHTGAVMPIAVQSVAVNGGVATFTDVAPSRVWVAAAFDERGGFAPDGPPPSGAPAGAYLVDGQMAPVAPGPDAWVQITFDDQFRIP